MKILLIHNHYKLAGGEDVVVDNEQRLLERNGHKVIRYYAHNDSVDKMGKVGASLNTVWSRTSFQQLDAVIRDTKPDVAHFHNWFMMISPAGYDACRKHGVPVVQTLHNYRLICPSAIFYRDGHVCEECMGKFFAMPAVQHGCYRGSKAASAVVAGMLTYHKVMGTWAHKVDRYIALTEFARQKFIEGGFDAAKLTVKPNFLADDPQMGAHRGDYFVFMGRWTQEKGVLTVLEAWRLLGQDAPPLKLLGEGPLDAEVRALAAQCPSVELVGKRSHDEAVEMLKDASVLIQPSEWYEGMPMTIVESLACGTPVIAANIGAASTMITHGHNGLHFTPQNAASLADAVRDMLSTTDRSAMQSAARTEFVNRYTAEANYPMLMEIYAHVVPKHT